MAIEPTELTLPHDIQNNTPNDADEVMDNFNDTATVVNRLVKRGKSICFVPFQSDTNCATGDGKDAFVVPAHMNGYNLTYAVAAVYTAGTTGTMAIQIRRVRAGSAVDMFAVTDKLEIDTTELTSLTAADPYAINSANDDLATGDLIFCDVDAIHTTPAKGLSVVLTFNKPD